MKIKISYLFGLFLFFLPFTQALTLNLFFPLKISELILVFLIFIFLQLKFDKTYLNTLWNTKILFAFLFLATISCAVNLFWTYPYPPKELDFRIGGKADSMLRLVYIYLNFFALLVSIFFLIRRKDCLKYWVYGAMVASIYAWYLFISSALNLPYIKLFGMEENPQTIMGIVRVGTFREGNFFGLYLILSSAIAFHLKKNQIAWFLMITILSTFSTISIISATLFLLFYFKKFLLRVSNIKTFLMLLPIILVGIFFFFRSEFYTKYIEQKLFTPLNTLTSSNFSKVDRYLTGSIAFKAGMDNPVVGVGPYNYGLHYDYYNNIDDIVDKQSEFSREFFKRKRKRAIPNNVYLEVWAEYGVLGFSLFIAFLINTLYISIKSKNLIITAGLLAMYLSLNAFPSFIMLFIWVYLGIPYALYFSGKEFKRKQGVES